MPRVLHVLSQRPGRTGSGVTIDALVRHAAGAGWDQCAVVGTPVDERRPAVGELAGDAIEPLVFGEAGGPLPFALPGMSDVMPYPSTVFAQMTPAQIAAYRDAWRRHLTDVIARVRPDVIHAHHAWIVGALLPDVAPNTPTFVHTHGTALRQLELCPHLADDVRDGARRNAGFAVLHDSHARAYARAFDVPIERCHVVGAGYAEDVFHARGRATSGQSLLFAGKLSHAKGLPCLLDAVARLAPKRPGLTLTVAGGGAGSEAEALRARMAAMHPVVDYVGMLTPAELAARMRQSDLFVLPSFYEGLPLVLVEARACGCRLVATRLPGIVSALAEPLGKSLQLVDLPPMRSVDRPVDADVPAFVARLTDALDAALAAPANAPTEGEPPDLTLAPLRWSAVFARVEALWTTALR